MISKSPPAFVDPVRLPWPGVRRATSFRSTCPVVNRSSPVEAPSAAPYITVDPFLTAAPKTCPKQVNPIVILPGYAAPSTDYHGIANTLRQTLPDTPDISVVPLTTWSWAATVGGRPMTPILSLVDQAVQAALRRTGASTVTLIGHSAGGWIARLYLGEMPYPAGESGVVWKGRTRVSQLLCLGTPQSSCEPVTKANMSFVNDNYPGAFYDDIEYINFGGDAVTIPENGARWWKIWDPLWIPRLSYELTDPNMTKESEAIGDGIVPLSCTFLDGAKRNIRLRGVWHAPDSRGPWYGDSRVVTYWSQFIK